MTRRLLASGAAIVAATVVSGCSIGHPNDYTLPGGTATGSDGYHVVGYFDTVDNLVPNSQVLYDEVAVGTVLKISAQDCRAARRPAACGSARGWRAKVTLSLKKSLALPRNVELKIGQKSLLGAEYLEVSKPADPQGRLAAGDTVAATGSYPATEDVLSAVSLLLNNGGLSQINTITTEINSALSGREGVARDLIGQLNTFATALNSRRNAVITALTATNQLSKTLTKQSATIDAALDRIGPGIKALNQQRTLLTSAIGKLGTFSTVATNVLDASHASLVSNLKNLQPVLTQLNASGDALPKALNMLTLPFPLENVSRIVRGDFANFFITIDATGDSLLGTLNSNPPTTPVRGASNAKTGTKTTAPTPTPSGAPTPKTTPTSTGSTPTPPAPTTPTCDLISHLLGVC